MIYAWFLRVGEHLPTPFVDAFEGHFGADGSLLDEKLSWVSSQKDNGGLSCGFEFPSLISIRRREGLHHVRR